MGPGSECLWLSQCCRDISRMVGPGTVEAQAERRAPPSLLAFNYPSPITASNPCNKPTPGGPHPPNSARFAGDLLWVTHMGGREECCTGASPQSTLETEQPSPSPTGSLSLRVRRGPFTFIPRPPGPFPPLKSPPLDGFLEKAALLCCLPSSQPPRHSGAQPVVPDACSSCDCVSGPVRLPSGCPQQQ